MRYLWTVLCIRLQRLQGRWRLWWGFCPQCNSDAPALYDCPVCEYYTGGYPPTEGRKDVWRVRFENELYAPGGYRAFLEKLRIIQHIESDDR